LEQVALEQAVGLALAAARLAWELRKPPVKGRAKTMLKTVLNLAFSSSSLRNWGPEMRLGFDNADCISYSMV
jgi:hypothetical protein